MLSRVDAWRHFCYSSEVFTLLFFMNLVRAQPLIESPILDARAQIRAEQLCTDHQWSHAGWLDSFSGLKYSKVGENLDKDFATPLDAFNALMQSPEHKSNIVDPKYTEVGIGHGSCKLDAVLFKG